MKQIEITKETREVFVYICPYCRKRIESLYYKQIKSLAQWHLRTHKEEESSIPES